MWKELRVHFFTGLLVLAPLFVTILVVQFLIGLVDRFFVNPIFQALPFEDADPGFKIFMAKLIIFVIVGVIVTFIGVFAEKLFMKQFFAAVEGILKSIPVFNKVYGSVQDISQAFFGDKKGVFKKVVYVEYPRKGVYTLGFVTQDREWDIHDKTGKEIYTVFIPSPPNPATGYFIFAPKEEIIEAGISIEEGIKLIISGGAAVPPLRRN